MKIPFKNHKNKFNNNFFIKCKINNNNKINKRLNNNFIKHISKFNNNHL